MKHGLSIRGDSLYCPLPISYDSYWNCLTNCYHCYFRRLNHVWGKDLRPSNPEALHKKLINGLKNKNPKSALAHCLRRKKTIRMGNKADPYQDVELKMGVSKEALKVFIKMDWSLVIQTRFTENMLIQNEKDILQSPKGLITVMPVISPGLDRDWEEFERGRTTPPLKRLEHLRRLKKRGINVGVNGEPFIPGVHRIRDFMATLRLLKEYGIPSYNTYNFHFNDYVAKQLHFNTSVDIEKIWYYNQDAQWKKILVRLLKAADAYGIKLGCPDFVNTGIAYHEPANTCCGINVPNPCTYNTHHWKKEIQCGCNNACRLVKNTYDGSGDLEEGKAIINGTSKGFYSLKDAGIII